MSITECWECDTKTENIHHHHVVPRSRGGTKTVPLCIACHSKAHHTNMNMEHSTLVKAGMRQARKNGSKIGNPRIQDAARKGRQSMAKRSKRYVEETVEIIKEIKCAGVITLTGIAKALNARGISTARGKTWTHAHVLYILRKSEQTFATN